MKEKEAAVKERLLKNVQEINGIKVIKFCLPMPAEVVKTSLSNFVVKLQKISSL